MRFKGFSITHSAHSRRFGYSRYSYTLQQEHSARVRLELDQINAVKTPKLTTERENGAQVWSDSLYMEMGFYDDEVWEVYSSGLYFYNHTTLTIDAMFSFGSFETCSIWQGALVFV